MLSCLSAPGFRTGQWLYGVMAGVINKRNTTKLHQFKVKGNSRFAHSRLTLHSGPNAQARDTIQRHGELRRIETASPARGSIP